MVEKWFSTQVLLVEDKTMVKEVKDVAARRGIGSDDVTSSSFDETAERRVSPLTTEELAQSFGKWVAYNPEFTFEACLKSWVAARREMKLSVNPTFEDPEEELKKPTKEFKAVLFSMFERVRARKGNKR